MSRNMHARRGSVDTVSSWSSSILEDEPHDVQQQQQQRRSMLPPPPPLTLRRSNTVAPAARSFSPQISSSSPLASQQPQVTQVAQPQPQSQPVAAPSQPQVSEPPPPPYTPHARPGERTVDSNYQRSFGSQLAAVGDYLNTAITSVAQNIPRSRGAPNQQQQQPQRTSAPPSSAPPPPQSMPPPMLPPRNNGHSSLSDLASVSRTLNKHLNVASNRSLGDTANDYLNRLHRAMVTCSKCQNTGLLSPGVACVSCPYGEEQAVFLQYKQQQQVQQQQGATSRTATAATTTHLGTTLATGECAVCADSGWRTSDDTCDACELGRNLATAIQRSTQPDHLQQPVQASTATPPTTNLAPAPLPALGSCNVCRGTGWKREGKACHYCDLGLSFVKQINESSRRKAILSLSELKQQYMPSSSSGGQRSLVNIPLLGPICTRCGGRRNGQPHRFTGCTCNNTTTTATASTTTTTTTAARPPILPPPPVLGTAAAVPATNPVAVAPSKHKLVEV